MEARVGTSIIIINKDNQILLGERQGSHGEGQLSLPGGHLEYGETYDECVSRELEEEVGISFPGQYEKVGFSEDFFGEKQYTTLYFAVKNVDPNIKVRNMEPDKCKGWKWYHISQVPNNLFCDSYEQIQSLFQKVQFTESKLQNSDNPFEEKYLSVTKEKWSLK